MSDAGAPLLEMQGIRKSFVGVEVLHGVDLDLRAGEIHAIVGENGAGKSTLVKILAGVHSPDEGTIRIDGERAVVPPPGRGAGGRRRDRLPGVQPPPRPQRGRERVRRPRAGQAGDRRPSRDGARAPRSCSRRWGRRQFSPRTLVRRLSVAQQQVVEIVKARSLDARILVLDEPTAALAEHEVELLFALVARLKEQGIGMLYISHRLREVFTLAERITVLKDGALVKTLPTTETDSRGLVNLMVGRELDGYFPPRGEPGDLGDVRLEVKQVSTDLLARRQPAGARRRDRRPGGAAGLGPHRARARDLRGGPAGERQHRARRQAGAAAHAARRDQVGPGLHQRGPQARGPRARPVDLRQHAAGRPHRAPRRAGGGGASRV